VEIIIKL